MESTKSCKVCVTGGAGYVASSIVKKLLNEGYTVHATLRNLDDHSKVDILKSFRGADTRLKLFEADIYRTEEFEPAIQGCEFVFHVATPVYHTEGQKYKNRVDATVDSARSIATACIRSGTVKRLIYTASVMSASPLKDDGSGSYKQVMDENCWTPINGTVQYNNKFSEDYTQGKTLAEKELLSFGNCGMEVVTLACGLVGGETLMQNTPGSVTAVLSLITNDEFSLKMFKLLEFLLAKVPIVHIEDVSNAHIFCMKEHSINGRFLCANGYVSIAEMADFYRKKFPEYSVKKEHFELFERETKWGSTLLNERGFEYKFDWQRVLQDSIRCARKNADLGI